MATTFISMSKAVRGTSCRSRRRTVQRQLGSERLENRRLLTGTPPNVGLGGDLPGIPSAGEPAGQTGPILISIAPPPGELPVNTDPAFGDGLNTFVDMPRLVSGTVVVAGAVGNAGGIPGTFPSSPGVPPVAFPGPMPVGNEVPVAISVRMPVHHQVPAVTVRDTTAGPTLITKDVPPPGSSRIYVNPVIGLATAPEGAAPVRVVGRPSVVRGSDANGVIRNERLSPDDLARPATKTSVAGSSAIEGRQKAKLIPAYAARAARVLAVSNRVALGASRAAAVVGRR